MPVWVVARAMEEQAEAVIGAVGTEAAAVEMELTLAGLYTSLLNSLS